MSAAILLAAQTHAEEPPKPPSILSRFVIEGTVGLGASIPRAEGPTFPVVEVAPTLQFFFLPRFAIAAQLRVGVLPADIRFGPIGPDLSGAAGVRANVFSVLFVRALVGYGASSQCPRGDYCGGAGPVGSLEVGIEGGPWPVRFVARLRLHIQFGMVNGVDELFNPSANVGLAW